MAARISRDRDVWLGAALPDVGAMGHFNLLGERPTGALAEGIALHHATDNLFHTHPWFKSHQANLYEALTTAGVRRGAARAVAHVGPELLLDGELLRHPDMKGDIESGMGRLSHHLDAVEVLVRQDRRLAWRSHLERVTLRDSPSHYDDPYEVAYSLERILRSRARLAVDADQVLKIGDILSTVHDTIRATALDLVEDLGRQLAV